MSDVTCSSGHEYCHVSMRPWVMSRVHDAMNIVTWSWGQWVLWRVYSRRFRLELAKFRTTYSNSKLQMEMGRHLGLAIEYRVCKLCYETKRVCIEDEFHVLINCPSYSSIREIYIGKVYTMYDFIQIMSSQNKNTQIRLAHFIHYMFLLRDLKLNMLITDRICV